MTTDFSTIVQQVPSTLNRERAHGVCPSRGACPNHAHYILINPEQLHTPQQDSP